MVMGKPSSNSYGSGGDEERLPLRGVLETQQQRAPGTPPPPAVHHAAEQLKEQARRGGSSRLWRASVRAGLVLCLLSVPAVLLLLRWQADASPKWVFDFEPPEDDDDDQGTKHSQGIKAGMEGSRQEIKAGMDRNLKLLWRVRRWSWRGVARRLDRTSKADSFAVSSLFYSEQLEVFGSTHQ